jgi:hypothetical protein
MQFLIQERKSGRMLFVVNADDENEAKIKASEIEKCSSQKIFAINIAELTFEEKEIVLGTMEILD